MGNFADGKTFFYEQNWLHMNNHWMENWEYMSNMAANVTINIIVVSHQVILSHRSDCQLLKAFSLFRIRIVMSFQDIFK